MGFKADEVVVLLEQMGQRASDNRVVLNPDANEAHCAKERAELSE